MIQIVEKNKIATCRDEDRVRTDKRFTSTLSHQDYFKPIGVHFNEWQKAALSRIHSVLDRGARFPPVSIGYCSRILKKYSGVPRLVDQMSDQECGPHASIVIGRRRNRVTGVCQFLVRTSWGRAYGQYSKKWEEEPGRGNVWVDADVLMKNTSTLTMIEEAK
jgi:hypothetical protein